MIREAIFPIEYLAAINENRKRKLITRGACPDGEKYGQRMFHFPLIPKWERSRE